MLDPIKFLCYNPHSPPEGHEKRTAIISSGPSFARPYGHLFSSFNYLDYTWSGLERQSPMSNKESFEGFHQFAFFVATPIPNTILDVLLPQLSEAELKVLLYIIRRTVGEKRATAAISYNQFIEGQFDSNGKRLDNGAGVGNTSLARAIKTLEDKNLIVKERGRTEFGGLATNTYSLKIVEGHPYA